MKLFQFDGDELWVNKEEPFVKRWGKFLLRLLLWSLLLSLLYYIIFALFFTTDAQRQLRRESKAIEAMYEELAESSHQLDLVVKGLQEKDQELYRKIFDADPPSFDGYSHEGELLYDPDSAMAAGLVKTTAQRLREMELRAEVAQQAIRRLDSTVKAGTYSIHEIPSLIPVADFIVQQTGATVGRRIQPFYKSLVEHTGLDLITGVGTEVFATADGVVTAVIKSEKGRGNFIRLEHKHGYETTYSHLASIAVRKGQKVERGQVIGRVGSTGMAFAPHLHYEVLLNGEYVDPINYFFVELSPDEYRDMLRIATNTGQSMD